MQPLRFLPAAKMFRGSIAIAVILTLAGCVSSSTTPPPERNTIVVPNGSTAICSDGSAPPCR